MSWDNVLFSPERKQTNKQKKTLILGICVWETEIVRTCMHVLTAQDF